MPNYFDDEDENIDDSYLLAQNDPQAGRINPVTKAHVIDMKTNPRIAPISSDEKLLPKEEKSEYWREEFRRGKDPRDVLNQYLLDKLTQRERELSPSYFASEKDERKQSSRDSRNMDLMKSVSDLGASFGNRRYSDPNSAIPVSGFDAEKPKSYMRQYKADVLGDQKRAEGLQGMDQQVLMYLADKKAKEEQAKADAKLKMDIAKMRAENDPFKALMFGMKQQDESRKQSEEERKKIDHENKLIKDKYEIAEKEKKSKEEEESVYRYKNTLKNIAVLKETVNDTSFWQAYPGTEMIGNIAGNILKKDYKASTKATEIESKIYDMALDYAKIVDPPSVAREGEVAAAKKYSLPIQNYIFTGNKDAALSILDKYENTIKERAKSRAKSSELPVYNESKPEINPSNKSSDKLNKLQGYYNRETNPQKKQDLLRMIEIEKKRGS